MMGRPRKVSREFLERVRVVTRARMLIPTDRELARDGNCSYSCVQYHIKRFKAEFARTRDDVLSV